MISLNERELLNATCLLIYAAWLSLRIQTVSPQHSFTISWNYVALLNHSYFQVILHPSMIGPSKSQQHAPLTIKNISMNFISYDMTLNPSTNPQLLCSQRTKYLIVFALISHFTNVLDHLSLIPSKLTEFISGHSSTMFETPSLNLSKPHSSMAQSMLTTAMESSIKQKNLRVFFTPHTTMIGRSESLYHSVPWTVSFKKTKPLLTFKPLTMSTRSSMLMRKPFTMPPLPS